ncbi:MAG: hypothetical protein R3D69_11955 [Xanthobacteraceae bacterium]
MQDLEARVQKLIMEAAECDLIANLAADPEKRSAFEDLARALRREAEAMKDVVASMRSRPRGQ